MEATLKLKDAFTGTLKSVTRNNLRLTITAPDNDLNRSFMLECLYQLQGRRQEYGKPITAGIVFPPLDIEKTRGRGTYTVTEIVSYGGFPVFETFGASRHDFAYANRVVECWNRFTGIRSEEFEPIPHVGDMIHGFDIMRVGVEQFLAGKIERDDLEAAYKEAAALFTGTYYSPFEPASRQSPFRNLRATDDTQ